MEVQFQPDFSVLGRDLHHAEYDSDIVVCWTGGFRPKCLGQYVDHPIVFHVRKIWTRCNYRLARLCR